MVVPSTSNGPNMVLHPALTDMVSPSNPTSTVVPSASSAPSTEVEAYDLPSSAAASTVVADEVSAVDGDGEEDESESSAHAAVSVTTSSAAAAPRRPISSSPFPGSEAPVW